MRYKDSERERVKEKKTERVRERESERQKSHIFGHFCDQFLS